MEFEKIVCPICEGDSGKTVYEKDHAVLFGNELRPCSLVQVICCDCGLIYTNPQPTTASLNEFYDQYFMYGELGDDPLRGRQLSFLLDHVQPAGKTLFDIGAHNGTFMNLAAGAGFEVMGIEPSARARQEAESRFGMKLLPGFFTESNIGSAVNDYDVVVLNHVLEHVKNPLEVLRLAGEITAEGGSVFVEVPDMENPQTDNMADFFTPEHTVYFTTGTLAMAASKVGLVLEHLERDEQKHAFRVLLRKAECQEVSREKHREECTRSQGIMEEYSARKRLFHQEIKERLRGISGKIIVYGAGLHTAQLFRSGVLEGLNVEAVVDSNPQRWGSLFDGFEVLSPQLLADGKFTVVISSHESQQQIADYLVDNFPESRPVKLYP